MDTVGFTEPRTAGLLQTVKPTVSTGRVAVLEQPTPRGVCWQKLGRRNIVLSQSDELNDPHN
ncbi:hypothetical protein FTUN_3227 [Frigoriglobus tundricola]|uniref:Uncharacterized protein n=1 Tax=Frigoriglobus tundricola TaxID=2774151 RepID=A0A6M5YQV2_9BACT|nr:hypothetical protein FTUN_3227 [Frigoriglobus tundricola]